MLSFYLISLCKWLYFCCYKKARARSLKFAMEIYISCSSVCFLYKIPCNSQSYTERSYQRAEIRIATYVMYVLFIKFKYSAVLWSILSSEKFDFFFISSSTDVSAMPLVILNKMADTSLSLAGFTPGMLKKSRIPNMHPKSKTFKIVLHIFVYQNSPYEQKRILQDLYHFYIVIKTFFFTGYNNYEIWRKKIIKSGSTNNFLLHIVIYTSIQNCWDTFFLYYFISTHVPPISLHNYLRQPVSNPLLWKQWTY